MVAHLLSLSPDLASSGHSSSSGSIPRCSTFTPTLISTSVSRGKGVARASPPSAVGSLLTARCRSPVLSSNLLGSPPHFHLLSHCTDRAATKKNSSVCLFSPNAAAVGEGSNAGGTSRQPGTDSFPLLSKPKEQLSVWVQKARLAALNKEA